MARRLSGPWDTQGGATPVLPDPPAQVSRRAEEGGDRGGARWGEGDGQDWREQCSPSRSGVVHGPPGITRPPPCLGKDSHSEDRRPPLQPPTEET